MEIDQTGSHIEADLIVSGTSQRGSGAVASPFDMRQIQRGARVTSAIHSPRLKRNIGYAMLPTADGKLGTLLTVATPWGEREATVVPRPFVDPKKEIPKS